MVLYGDDAVGEALGLRHGIPRTTSAHRLPQGTMGHSPAERHSLPHIGNSKRERGWQALSTGTLDAFPATFPKRK